MTKHYFLDSSALLGLTFFSDRWFQEAYPLYNDRRELHISELVLREYCNYEKNSDEVKTPEDTSQIDPDWKTEAGKFQDLKDDLKEPLSEYTRQIRRLDRSGMVLEDAIETFIDHFEIREEAEPQIRAYFEDKFEERVVNAHYVNRYSQELVDRVLYTANKNRAKLAQEVTVHESRYDTADDIKTRWDELPDASVHNPDLSILVDATVIADRRKIDYFVSGDSDHLAVQEFGNDYFDLSIISIADTFHPTSGLPQSKKQKSSQKETS
jgi:hypothetical protein